MNNQLLNAYAGNMRGINNGGGYYPTRSSYPPQSNNQGINTNIEFIIGGEQAVNVIQLPVNTSWSFWDREADVIYVKNV